VAGERALRLAALLFVVTGSLAVLELVGRLLFGGIFWNGSVLALPIGIGLLKRREWARAFGIVLSVLQLVALVGFAATFGGGHPEAFIGILAFRVYDPSLALVLLTAGFGAAMAGFQLWALRLDSVRALTASPA